MQCLVPLASYVEGKIQTMQQQQNLDEDVDESDKRLSAIGYESILL